MLESQEAFRPNIKQLCKDLKNMNITGASNKSYTKATTGRKETRKQYLKVAEKYSKTMKSK